MGSGLGRVRQCRIRLPPEMIPLRGVFVGFGHGADEDVCRPQKLMRGAHPTVEDI